MNLQELLLVTADLAYEENKDHIALLLIWLSENQDANFIKVLPFFCPDKFEYGIEDDEGSIVKAHEFTIEDNQVKFTLEGIEGIMKNIIVLYNGEMVIRRPLNNIVRLYLGDILNITYTLKNYLNAK